MIERRAEERVPRVLIIRCGNVSSAGMSPPAGMSLALTSNVSRSGVAFRSLTPVAGRVRLVNDALWGTPREGIVKWCAETSPGVFKVGVALS